MNHEKLKEIQETLPAHVTLVAVSKTRTKEEIDEAYAAGCTVFGENKVQEIVRKHDPRYHWHMIGHLQRNKVRQVLPLVDMIQSLDSLSLAKEIEKQAAKIDKKVAVLVEVNISQETNKSGITAEETMDFIDICRRKFPHIEVQGLMCVGPRNGSKRVLNRCISFTCRHRSALAIPSAGCPWA